jgi:hypothetical protein
LVEAVDRLMKHETDRDRMAMSRRARRVTVHLRVRLGRAAAAEDSPLPPI